MCVVGFSLVHFWSDEDTIQCWYNLQDMSVDGMLPNISLPVWRRNASTECQIRSYMYWSVVDCIVPGVLAVVAVCQSVGTSCGANVHGELKSLKQVMQRIAVQYRRQSFVLLPAISNGRSPAGKSE